MNLLKRLSVFCLIVVMAACSNAQGPKEEAQESQDSQETQEPQEPKESQGPMKGGFTVTAFSDEDNFIELSDGEKVEGISETYVPIFVNGELSRCITAFIEETTVYVPTTFMESDLNMSIEALGEGIMSIAKEDITYYALSDALENTDWEFSFVDMNDDAINSKALVRTQSSVYLYNTEETKAEGLSSEDGLDKAKVILNESLEAFSISLRENLESSKEDTSRFDGELEQIQQDIDALSYMGETLGYYIYDMNIYRVMVDKYSGQVYVNYETGLATYNVPIDLDGEDISDIFMPLYIVG